MIQSTEKEGSKAHKSDDNRIGHGGGSTTSTVVLGAVIVEMTMITPVISGKLCSACRR